MSEENSPVPTIAQDAPPAGVATESPAAETATIAAAIPEAATALEAWLVRHIHNSVYSRDTEVFNRIYVAVAQIKAAMAGVA